MYLVRIMTIFAWMLKNTNFERLEELFPISRIICGNTVLYVETQDYMWKHRIDSKFLNH